MVPEATRETFHDLVAEGVTLVDVWGPLCQPCIALRPHVEQLAEDRAGELKVVALEAPANRRLCLEMRLMGLPTFLLFRDGTEIGRLTGNDINATRLDGWIDATVGALAGPEGG